MRASSTRTLTLIAFLAALALPTAAQASFGFLPGAEGFDEATVAFDAQSSKVTDSKPALANGYAAKRHGGGR